MNQICKCNICGGKDIKSVYKLKNIDLVGMAEEYTQDVSACLNCGFIYTKNPFEEEKLSNRYKNFSKFEFDSSDYILEDAADYKIKSKRQWHFIDRVLGLEKIESILEIGSASGYNLSLYKNNAKVYGVEPSYNNCRSVEKNMVFLCIAELLRSFTKKEIWKRCMI